MVLDSEKLFTAFLGALIALILKAVYDWIIEAKKNERIKQLIRTDLKRKIENIDYIVKGIKKILDEPEFNIKTLITFLDLDEIVKVNTYIFESNSYIDYHKAYTEKEFNDLMSLYDAIRSFYGINPVNTIRPFQELPADYNDWDEQQRLEYIQFTKDSSDHVILYLKGLVLTKVKIQSFMKLTDPTFY